MDQLKAALAADDMDAFQALLSGPQAHTIQMTDIMPAALAHDHVGAVAALMRRDKMYALRCWDFKVAIAAHAKRCFALLLEQGWDMNDTWQSINMPPHFTYVPDLSVAGSTWS